MKNGYILAFILLFVSSLRATPPKPRHLIVSPERGDGIWTILRRYELHTNPSDTKAFYRLNGLHKGDKLLRHKSYKLPIYEYKYNGKSIRSTLEIKDWDLAVHIQKYNEKLTKKKVKPLDYRVSKKLWVPLSMLHAPTKTSKQKKTESKKNRRKQQLSIALFGPKYKNITVKSNKLKGQVFYIVSGHGGPDPGAIARKVKNKYDLCEDEYAYDVALRLARKLMENGALVHILIQDKNDGIRDHAWLQGDKDETCMGKRIPLSQLKRLQQRTETINKLYRQHRRTGVTKHKVICIHVDSRSVHRNQDVFFYYYAKSKAGKHIATNVYNTFKAKYHKYQRNRGYHGSISSRPLYLLKNTLPPAVYVELANIRNEKDRIRLLKPANRDALALWLYEGLIKN